MNIEDWHQWHGGYDDPDSEVAGRLKAVRRHVTAVVDASPPGPVNVLSICGGQGRELIGALQDHPRRLDVRGRLIELDPENAAIARRSAGEAQMQGLEVVTGDASLSDAYEGLPPADLIVISGLFGHLDQPDQMSTIRFLRQLSRPGGSIVWTASERPTVGTDALRNAFAGRSFEELAFERIPGNEYLLTVTLSRNSGSLEPFQRHARIFSFGSSRRGRPGAPS